MGRKMSVYKRTMPIRGEGEDKDKWFRCWNCGFPCNVERNSLDTGEHGGSGVTTTTTTIESATVYYPVIAGSCSFCGCKNYK